MDKDAAIDRQFTVLGKSHFGKFGTPQPHQAYRPGLWYLMQSDPHDAFDGWRWSCTNWVTADSDPCDDWPYISVGGSVAFIASFGFDFGLSEAVIMGYRAPADRYVGEYHGHPLDFVVIDECHYTKPLSYYSHRLGGKTAELRDRLTAAEAMELVKAEAPLSHYDYQRHNKVRKRRP